MKCFYGHQPVILLGCCERLCNTLGTMDEDLSTSECVLTPCLFQATRACRHHHITMIHGYHEA